MGVVSKANKGWTSFADMIADAKANNLRFGTMSPKLSDLAFLLGEAQGVEFNIVQVKGGKAVMNGVQAGDMDLGFMAGIQGKGVASGDLVNLASAMSKPLIQTQMLLLLLTLGYSSMQMAISFLSLLLGWTRKHVTPPMLLSQSRMAKLQV